MNTCHCLSGVRFPAGSRESPLPQKVHTGSGTHPASCPMDIVDYTSRLIGRDVKLALEPELTMRGPDHYSITRPDDVERDIFACLFNQAMQGVALLLSKHNEC